MATNTIPTFRTDQFVWDGTTGSVDASDLGIRAGDPRPTHFTVQSTKVEGYSLMFWFWSEEVRGGDLVSSTYVTTRDGKYIVIKVWND